MLKYLLSIFAPFLGAALLALSFTTSANAAGNTKCGVRDDIVQLLEAKYQEGRVAVALSHKSTAAFEIFVSPTGTWTVMRTSTRGETCIMAAGHSWENVDEKIKGGKES